MDESNYKRLAIGAPLFTAISQNCSVDGCGRDKAARGWCKMHWARWKKHGDPLGGNWATPKMPDACEIEGCSRESRSRWEMGITVCAMHYLRRMQTGSFDNPRGEPSPDGLCVADGCVVATRSPTSQHCERHYYQIRRTGSIFTKVVKGKKVVAEIVRYSECQYCGKPSTGNKYCNGRCGTRAWRGIPVERNCNHCGISFEPIDGAICCSDECKRLYVRKWAKARWRERMDTDPAFRAQSRHNEYRRKALKKNAFIEHVDRDAVMARDKWVCHLCGDKIPKTAKWPSGLFGTLEHVQPLADGGAHSYNNIKAAHLSCNCKKGAKTIGQLGLAF